MQLPGRRTFGEAFAAELPFPLQRHQAGDQSRPDRRRPQRQKLRWL